MQIKKQSAGVLIALINIGLGGDVAAWHGGEAVIRTAPSVNDIWREVFRLAAKHGVVAIAWDGVERIASEGLIAPELMPDRTLRLQWAVSVDNISKRYRKHEALIGKLAAFYHEHNIRLMLLKGYGMSLNYPTPEHRECGDIDIWQFGEQKRADQLLRDIKGVKIDEDVHHHTTFVINGVLIENHFDFINVHAHTSNKLIERELQRYAREEEPATTVVNGATVYLPSPNLNALFLLKHAASHFAAVELIFRQVLDWVLFVKHHHESIDWPWLYNFAKQMNMHRFLNCLNAIAIDHFGLDASTLPPFERDRALEERVLNDIIEPEFNETSPRGNILRSLIFKFRRWWANRWKHRLVHREGLLHTFVVQVYSHLLKPKTLR